MPDTGTEGLHTGGLLCDGSGSPAPLASLSVPQDSPNAHCADWTSKLRALEAWSPQTPW